MAATFADTQQHAIVTRQTKVAQLRLAGVTNQNRIANILQVDQRTISADFAEIDRFWREKAAVDIASAKGQDIERCERLIAAIWEEAIKGKLAAIKMVVTLMERRAKLLGLDAPITVNVVQDEARRLAAEFGLDIAEILSEAQRIVSMPQTLELAAVNMAGPEPKIEEFE